MSISFRIRCCLCAKNIPLAGDVIAVDAEWQRRYPKMRGILACERCVIDYGWNCCTKTAGGFVDGHIAAPPEQVDMDSWSHLLERGTHRALVALYPQAGLLQGAEPYVRSLASRKVSPRLAARLTEALGDFDVRQPVVGT
ncbi:hypothetical protein ABZ829_22240 [Streptomyces xanthochromogenes]|uniref:hypothetical protein n=1 Tax=Streptomyces xanthochromogenes TaxID=67384 RepID=UPI0034182B00